MNIKIVRITCLEPKASVNTILFLLLFLILMQTANGQCIRGDCVNGRGIYTQSNGYTYTGNWKNGKYNGMGTLVYEDGQKYVGEWKNGYYHGVGIFTFSSASFSSGKWESGKFVYELPVNEVWVIIGRKYPNGWGPIFVSETGTKNVSNNKTIVRKRITFPPRLIVEVELDEPSGNRILDAGEKGQISLKIQNNGTGSGYGIAVGITPKSTRGLTYLSKVWIPEIPADGEKTIRIPLEALIDLSDGVHVFRFSFDEVNGFPPDPIELEISTRALPPAGFEIFDILVKDDSGDQRIDVGEVCELTLRVSNTGQGSAKGVTASFLFGENVFDTQRHPLTMEAGDIAAGGYIDLMCEFFINTRVADEIPLYLSISESTHRADIDRMRLPLWKGQKTKKVERTVVSGIEDTVQAGTVMVPSFIQDPAGGMDQIQLLMEEIMRLREEVGSREDKEYQLSIFIRESGIPVRSAVILIDGIEYETDEDGEVLYDFLDGKLGKKVVIKPQEGGMLYSLKPRKIKLGRFDESKVLEARTYHTLVNFVSTTEDKLQGLTVLYEGEEIGEILPSGHYKLIFDGSGDHDIEVQGPGYDSFNETVSVTRGSIGKERRISVVQKDEPVRVTVSVSWAGSGLPVAGKFEVDRPYQTGYVTESDSGRYTFEFFDRSAGAVLSITATDISGSPFRDSYAVDVPSDQAVYDHTQEIVIGSSPDVTVLVDEGKRFSVFLSTDDGDRLIDKYQGRYDGKLPAYGLYKVVQYRGSGGSDTTRHGVYNEQLVIDLRRGDLCNRADSYFDEGDWASYLDQVDRLGPEDDCYCSMNEEAGRVGLDELGEYARAAEYLNKVAYEHSGCEQWKSPYLHLRRLQCYVELNDDQSFSSGTEADRSFSGVVQLISPGDKEELLCQRGDLLGRLMYQERQRLQGMVKSSKDPARISMKKKEEKLVRRMAIRHIEGYENTNKNCQSLQNELIALKK